MKTTAFVAVLLLLLGTVLFAGVVSADPITVNASGTVNTSQTTTQRMFRDGTPSTCGGKVYPGPFSNSTFGYTVEGSYGPVGVDSCITVFVDVGTCGTNVFAAAFLDSFDPAWGPDNAANYLGDAGASQTGFFSFPVSAGDTFILVFMNTSSLQGCDYSFSFTYEGSSAGCTLAVPEGSVVGDTPYNAQVYYEPGNVSPGVFLNPGTYIVTGMDESGEYYQIMLACAFVWVRAEDMQPSYAPPQNGAPLPTRVIGSEPSDDGASGGGSSGGGSASD